MDEAIEIVVFISAGILIALIIIGIIFGWKIDKDVFNLYDRYQDNPDLSFDNMDAEEFTMFAYKVWTECNHTYMNMTHRAYVYYNGTVESGNITLQSMFDTYRSLSWCSSIQSKNQSCGTREDVNISGNITLPVVLSVRCENSTLFIR